MLLNINQMATTECKHGCNNHIITSISNAMRLHSLTQHTHDEVLRRCNLVFLFVLFNVSLSLQQ